MVGLGCSEADSAAVRVRASAEEGVGAQGTAARLGQEEARGAGWKQMEDAIGIWGGAESAGREPPKEREWTVGYESGGGLRPGSITGMESGGLEDSERIDVEGGVGDGGGVYDEGVGDEGVGPRSGLGASLPVNATRLDMSRGTSRAGVAGTGNQNQSWPPVVGGGGGRGGGGGGGGGGGAVNGVTGSRRGEQGGGRGTGGMGGRERMHMENHFPAVQLVTWLFLFALTAVFLCGQRRRGHVRASGLPA